MAHSSMEFDSLKGILSFTKKFSPTLKRIKSELKSDYLRTWQQLASYDTNLNGSLIWSDEKRASASPFAASSSSSTNLDLSLEKKFSNGMKPFVGKRFEESEINYASGSKISSKKTALDIGIKWDLFQEGWKKKSSMLFKNVKLKQKSTDVSYLLKEKLFLNQVKSAVLMGLQAFQNMKLIKEKCLHYQSVLRLSQKRFKRGVLEKRDLLLSRTQVENCRVQKENSWLSLQEIEMQIKNIIRSEGDLLKFNWDLIKWPLPPVDLKPMNWLEVSKNEYQVQLFSLLYLSADETLKISAVENTSSLELEAKTSLEGLDNDWGGALGESYSGDHPNFSIGLKWSLPLGNNSKDYREKEMYYQKKMAKFRVEEFRRMVANSLRSHLSQIKIIRKNIFSQKSLINLEKEKINYFRRDFNRGRVNLKDLIDNENSLIEAKINLLKLKYSEALLYSRYLLDQNRIE